MAADQNNKKTEIIGARFSGPELNRWAQLVQRVKTRNKLARASDVLRDLLFGDLGLVTNADRRFLQGISDEQQLQPEEYDEFLESAWNRVSDYYRHASEREREIALEMLRYLESRQTERPRGNESESALGSVS